MAMDSSANPKPSRWSDGTVGAEEEEPRKRPASSLSESAYKKPKPDSTGFLSAEASSGYGNIPPAENKVINGGQGTEGGDSLNGQSNAGYGGFGDGYGYGSVSQNQSFSSGEGGGRTGLGVGGGFAPGSAKGSGTGALFYKTKLCTKFKLGTCTFSDRCHFAHGIEDLRKPPPGWEELAKTNLSSGKVVAEAPRRSSKPCRYFFEGNCPYGERCTFSHGGEESQRYDGDQVVERSAVGVAGYGASSRPNYKTRICARWEKGEICSYGEKCHFAHGQTELRPYSGGPNFAANNMAPPTMYSEPGMMNQTDPYGGGQVNYANTGGLPMSSTNVNAYPGAGGVVNPYGTTQGNTNGYSTNYNYWNPENKWSGMGSTGPIPSGVVSNQSYVQPNVTAAQPQSYVQPNLAAPTQSYVQPTATAQPNQSYPQPNPTAPPTQGYGQANPTAQWMGNYSNDSGYAQNETNVAHYTQDPSQQQQSVQYYGSAPTYQGVNQTLSYAPDGTPSNYQNQTEPKTGDVSTYYGATGYTTQQTGYVSSYNTA